MYFENVIKKNKIELEKMFQSKDSTQIGNACLSASYYEEDWQWVLKNLKNIILNYSFPFELRNLAITCLGHLVRSNNSADIKVIKTFLKNEKLSSEFHSVVEDALDDIKIFSK